MNIPKVYEDDWLLVLDKPSGLLVIPSPRNESRTLTSILNDDAKEKNLTQRYYPCHRLDRETSGLIIYAKTRIARDKVMELFKTRQVSKKYLAFVRGQLPGRQGKISRPVDGKTAVTGYQVLEQRRGFSVVALFPQTGRKNQIRVHFMLVGHPLVGETRFARRKDSPVKAKRVCLHAQELSFRHPFTGRQLCLESSIPADMQALLEKNP